MTLTCTWILSLEECSCSWSTLLGGRKSHLENVFSMVRRVINRFLRADILNKWKQLRMGWLWCPPLYSVAMPFPNYCIASNVVLSTMKSTRINFSLHQYDSTGQAVCYIWTVQKTFRWTRNHTMRKFVHIYNKFNYYLKIQCGTSIVWKKINYVSLLLPIINEAKNLCRP